MQLTDLTFTTDPSGHSLALTGFADTPEILKKAITLMLFSTDESIRNFDGQSIVNAFPTLAQGGFNAINFNLSLAASKIAEVLRSEYPEVESVYFETSEASGVINVTLNIFTADGETLNTVVYSE